MTFKQECDAMRAMIDSFSKSPVTVAAVSVHLLSALDRIEKAGNEEFCQPGIEVLAKEIQKSDLPPITQQPSTASFGLGAVDGGVGDIDEHEF